MDDAQKSVHVPVLLEAVLEELGAVDEQSGQASGSAWLWDCTVGAGGHASAFLQRNPRACVLGFDQDPEILQVARGRLEEYGERVLLAHACFSELCAEFAAGGLPAPAAILADLGVSSLQLDRAERGFSLQADGPLDMRMDPRREHTAADLVNDWGEADLADLFFQEGGESRSRRVARAIVEARRRTPFQRTLGLAEVVAGAVGGRDGRLHPATRVFQALRRAVNAEGEELEALLGAAEELLPDGGRLVVIAFHSGEDAVVKRFMAKGSKSGRWELARRKPLRPDALEQQGNRRARSARLRSASRRRTEGGGR